MLARVGAAGAIAALALGATALAQAPAAPVGNFGGGNVLAPPSDPLGKGNIVIGLRTQANRKIQVEATIRGKCGGGTFPAKGTLAASGHFRLKGTSKRIPEKGLRLRTTYDISGTLTAAGVGDGVASATTRISATGQESLNCKSGKVAFQVRRPSAAIGTPGAPPNARYYGVTSERRHSARRGFVMRVSTDGTQLTRALYGVTLRCGKRKIPDIVDTPRRDLTIDAQGGVTDNVKSKFREGTRVTTSVETFTGTLGSTGALGTLSITERSRSRKTGKLLETCKTGKISWNAAP